MRGSLPIAADGIRAEILPFGASLVRVEVPDRDRRWANVTVAMSDPEAYRDPHANAYVGAMVGRYANRIAGASFELDGVRHRLEANEGPNTLHGGASSWARREWSVQAHTSDSVTLLVESADGDGGFPGDVLAIVEYSVAASTLSIQASVAASAPTVVSLTNHAYWNLAGDGPGACIDEHLLHLAAADYLAVDDALLPTGERRAVSELLDGRPLGGRRLDHCVARPWDPWDGGWEPTLATHVATLTDPRSGRRMWMRSNQPGLQVYTADTLGLGARRGVALEAQQLPDAPNQPTFPSPVVRPGDGLFGTVRWAVAYSFDVVDA